MSAAANLCSRRITGIFYRPRLAGWIALSLVFFLAACRPAPEPPIVKDPGQVVAGEDVYGAFYSYVPTVLPPQPQILVLVHGTPPQNESAEQNAQYFIHSWAKFAEKNGFILIAPAFTQENFSSVLGDHALGGYRGLFGREIGAYEWVLRLVKTVQRAFGLPDEPFYVYGHSAGGQFTARFLVTHPELVQRAVITAAATYPQPVEALAWPFGMGALHSEIVWDDGARRQVDVVPDREKWLAATQVPLTVIIGLNDTGELPAELIPGQNGSNRLVIGTNWVQAMDDFAQANGLESRFKVEVIPGQGHTMGGLLRYSQAELLAP